jgi:integrase
MVRINFNLRHQNKGAESPVNIVIRWNGNRIVYPSGERIDPRHWSVNSQAANRTYRGYSDFNLSLSNITATINKTFRNLSDKLERSPNVQELRDELDMAFKRKNQFIAPTFFQFIQTFIEQAQTRVNPDTGERYALTTLKKYRSTFAHLKEFATAKRRVIDFGNVDLIFYDQFNEYLTNLKGLSLNTIGKYIQTIKTFLRAANETGIEVNQSYRTRRFKTPSELTDKIYLTAEELNEMFHFDLSKSPRLEMVRDLFLVGAWTGLRFSDFTTIKPEQITGDRIRVRTLKTGATVVIPFHPCVRMILEKYSGKYPNSLPPAISNQKMNAYLKELTSNIECLQSPVMVSSTVAGKRKTVTKRKCELITTHTARRSFATNMYKMGCPTRSIMAITGHKTEGSFRAYIRLESDEHADIIQMFMDRTSFKVVDNR